MEHRRIETFPSIVIVYLRKESIWLLSEKDYVICKEKKSDRQI